MTDPYAPYLRQAEDLFAKGEIVKAGQIWQAILKQVPSHGEARTGLIKVKQILDARKAQAPVPPPAVAQPAPAPMVRPAAASSEEVEKLLREGCTLYDMGQWEDALQKWGKLLRLAPDHAMARNYLNGARRELGMPPLGAGEVPAAPPEEAPAPAPAPMKHGEDVEKLLLGAVQLYDMGLTEEAIAKWEKALSLEPHRADIQGYIRQAKAELDRQASPPSGPAAAPSAAPQPQPTASHAAPAEIKVSEGEGFLAQQRYEDAALAFRQALDLQPGHPQAQEGLRRAESGFLQADPSYGLPVGMERPDRPVSPTPTETASEVEEASAAHPPDSLTRAQSPQREGLKAPSSLDETRKVLDRHPQLKNPKLLAGMAGGLLALIATCSVAQGMRAESRRQDAVKSAASAAIAEVSQETQAVDLNERAQDVKAEAQDALGAQPLLAYLRAEYLLKLTPGDEAAAQLFQKARADLAGGAAGASLAEAQRHLQERNLDAAAKVFDALLRADPGDQALRIRYARLQSALAIAYVGQEKWEKAKAHLLLGRALQAGDRAWALRLHAFELVQSLPRGAQRESWLAFLG